MMTAHFGIFEPAKALRHLVAGKQKPFFSDELPLSRAERDIAILTDKLPPEDDEGRRYDGATFASWSALVNH